jgi:hypothetical protein
LTSTPIHQFSPLDNSSKLFSSNSANKDSQIPGPSSSAPVQDVKLTKGSSPLPTIERLKSRSTFPADRTSLSQSKIYSDFPSAAKSVSIDSSDQSMLESRGKGSLEISDSCKSSQNREVDRRVNTGNDSANFNDKFVSNLVKTPVQDAAGSSCSIDSDGALLGSSLGYLPDGVKICANLPEEIMSTTQDSSADSCSSRETCV